MTALTREQILTTFLDYGFGPASDPHSWRCYHPDRYGDCTCAADLADALLDLQDTCDLVEDADA